MNPRGWEDGVAAAKIAGVRRLRGRTWFITQNSLPSGSAMTTREPDV
jgi:hypothetical protein